jgi:hypothetical protein
LSVVYLVMVSHAQQISKAIVIQIAVSVYMILRRKPFMNVERFMILYLSVENR